MFRIKFNLLLGILLRLGMIYLGIYFCKYISIFLKNNFFDKLIFYYICKNIRIMIQRIQSVYMFLSFLLMAIVSFFIPMPLSITETMLWITSSFSVLNLLFLFSGILSIIAIFMYQNRKLQFVLNRVSILINLILLGLFIFQSIKLPGVSQGAMKGIEMCVFLPIISVILLVMANKAIQKDEDLVKSVDRIR